MWIEIFKIISTIRGKCSKNDSKLLFGKVWFLMDLPQIKKNAISLRLSKYLKPTPKPYQNSKR